MELSVISTVADSWGGYRIPRNEVAGSRGEMGRLSMAESASAVAARIAGKVVFLTSYFIYNGFLWLLKSLLGEEYRSVCSIVMHSESA
jgi:hypothetical protein